MLSFNGSKVAVAIFTLIGVAVLTPMAGALAKDNMTVCSKAMPSASKAMGGSFSMATGNIVETAQNEGVFSTLIVALKATGLDQTLADKTTKFTVFAPTDEAFSKLPPGTVEMLLMPENKAKLTKILTYHVVMDPMTATDIQKNNLIRTVEGSTLKASTVSGKPFINNSQITKTDIYATNGIVHVIDNVLMPTD
jgi:uncharacterized surface protein with fasciclin (FAS1) repeats